MIERRIRIGDFLVPYDDAAEEVVVLRTMADILAATPGSDTECMNSWCIRAQRNLQAFPHPVYVVSTIKSRVYIVDQLTDAGKPSHAVRYELTKRDRALIDAHDRHGAGEPGTLKLKIPHDPKGSPHRKASSPDGRFGSKPGRYSGDGTATLNRRPVTSQRGPEGRVSVAVGARKSDAIK